MVPSKTKKDRALAPAQALRGGAHGTGQDLGIEAQRGKPGQRAMDDDLIISYLL